MGFLNVLTGENIVETYGVNGRMVYNVGIAKIISKYI